MGGCASAPTDEALSKSPAKRQNPSLQDSKRETDGEEENSYEDAGYRDGYVPAAKMKLKDLKAGTNDFARDMLLGEGSFGKVYRGKIADPTVQDGSGRMLDVAVKKLNPDSFQGYQEWLAEILFLDKLRHPNLVRLLGYCKERRESLLVYELCQYGSLEDALFSGVGRDKQLLTWPQRVQIAKDMTAGLQHLHQHNVIHRDFKASNILLVDDFRARITDFGLAKAGPDGGKTHVSTRVMGTLGYLDPTYMSTGRLTKKSDVYALGVTFLELITGRKSVSADGSESLTTWVRPYISQRRPDLDALVDPRLGDDYSKPGLVKLIILAKHCVNEDPDLRPGLDVVVTSLNKVDLA